MMRLIVDEGGKRRAFRVGQGKLSIGSGASAQLRLESPDVADVHCELEVSGERAILQLRPGVQPPQCAGIAMRAGEPWPLAKAVQLGAAVLTLQSESAAAAVGAPVAAPTRAPALAAARTASPRRAAPESAERPARAGRRSTTSSAIPWVLAVPAALVLGFVVFKLIGGSGGARAGAESNLITARAALDLGGTNDARQALDAAQTDPDLSPEQSARLDAMRRELVEGEQSAAKSAIENKGTEWLEIFLRKYEARWLQGNYPAAHVRLFLQRCREFRQRWPTHPELDWVQRQETRFAGVVDLTSPLSCEDVEWQAKLLSESSPKDFGKALGLIDEYLTRASGPEGVRLGDQRQAIVEARQKWFTEQLYDAQGDYQKGQHGEAVETLVQLVIGSGEPAMAKQAAEILLKIPAASEYLANYKRDRPADFERLLREPSVKAFAAANGV